MLLGEVVVVVLVEEALGPEAVAAAARSLLAHVGVGAPGKRLLQCPQSQFAMHSFISSVQIKKTSYGDSQMAFK